MIDEPARLAELVAAERRAVALLDRIETDGLIAPGRTERDVERDIYALAEREFGVTKHWHKRICRAGANTVCVAADNPPIRSIGADDIVYLDLGPVFGTWEADVGRSYVLGDDPVRRALCDDLPVLFDHLRRAFLDMPGVTGAALYDLACAEAAKAGWIFGGRIAGHIVAEFPHARIPGPKQPHHISPENPDPLDRPDDLGRRRYWIGEIHLLDRDRRFGGFYERLLLEDTSAASS